MSRSILLTLVALLLGACAVAPKPPAETMAQRVQKRWDIVVAGDLKAAYGFFSPALRESVSYESYLQSVLTRTVHWTKGEFREVVGCEDVVCKVRVAIHYEVNGLAPGQGTFKSVRMVIEDWIEVDGIWYFVPPDIL